MELEQKVMEILSEIVGAENGELETDLNLFEAGLLDSFGVVQLIVELEEKIGVSLEAENLSREELATPFLIIQWIEAAL